MRYRSWIALAVLVVLGLTVRRFVAVENTEEGEARPSQPKVGLSGGSTRDSKPVLETFVAANRGADPLHADEALRKLLERYKIKMAVRAPTMSPFARDEHYGFREGRLLALAYPAPTLEFASACAQDASRSVEERGYSCFLLGVLARNGDARASKLLATLAGSEDSAVGRMALSRLGEADQDGAYRALYLERCRVGWREGYRAVSRWPDQATAVVMKEIAASNPGLEYHESSKRRMAEGVLEKVELLASPDFNKDVLDILRGTSTSRSEWFSWALEVSVLRNVPDLAAAIRVRLDSALRGVETSSESAGPRSGSSDSGAGIRNAIVSDANLFTNHDSQYDDLLVVQHMIGGDLREVELLRLRTFGYACDPEKRVKELLDRGD